MKNILVPCDFSKPSEEAFKFAVEIAKQNNARIHVLYVIDITFLKGHPNLSQAYAFNLDFLEEIEKNADQKFQVMWERYAPMTLPVTFKHVISSLTSEIKNYVNTKAIDLVVMGTHGEGNAGFGSNTEKVVRNIDVPVLTVRACPSHIKDIVVPVLPYTSDERFVNELKLMQSFFQARLHLLYINTPSLFRSDDDSTDELKAFAQDRLDNYSINARSDYNVEAGIAHFAKEINADMIAMGTHAWKGVTRLLIGSVAEEVVSHNKIPIWTLRLN